MRVLVTGLRGIPDIQGGVETHAQQLYPLLAARGIEVCVICRSPFWSPLIGRSWRGVVLKKIWAPKLRGLEAFLHTLLSVLYAGVVRPNILHVHAIGPGLFVPLARLLGLTVVFTHHGADYEREKWGAFGKTVLRVGEQFAVRFANASICISRTIQRSVALMGSANTFLIPNGVPAPDRRAAGTEIQNLGLSPGRYVLLVSRFVPEKRHIDLIRAFRVAAMDGWKLVLVGGHVEHDPYYATVRSAAAGDPNVVFAGQKTNAALCEIYSNAGIFVLPSSHEGLPIALLEALSYGLSVLVSDIEPHKEIGMAEGCYFRMGDVESLASSLRQIASGHGLWETPAYRSEWVMSRYCWRTIADETARLYVSQGKERQGEEKGSLN